MVVTGDELKSSTSKCGKRTEVLWKLCTHIKSEIRKARFRVQCWEQWTAGWASHAERTGFRKCTSYYWLGKPSWCQSCWDESKSFNSEDIMCLTAEWFTLGEAKPHSREARLLCVVDLVRIIWIILQFTILRIYDLDDVHISITQHKAWTISYFGRWI